MTTGTETDTVSRETPVLPLAFSEVVPATPASVDVLADARAEARSWSSNTRRAYVAGWNHFTSWCIEHRCAGLPSAAADVGHYIEHLVETEGKTLATARTRLAAIAAAHRLPRTPRPDIAAAGEGHHETAGQGVRKTAEAGEWPDQRAPGRGQGHGADPAGSPRGDAGARRPKPRADTRALVDLALLEVMRDGLLRGSEASAFRWGELEFHADGSGRVPRQL